MSKENICHFLPYDADHGQLDTINFVLEVKPQVFTALQTQAVYKMHLVCAGRGKLHTPGKIMPLQAGDLFFTFPAEAFAIESEEGFEYLYISFLGSRGNKLLEQLKIDRHHAVFHGCAALSSFWLNAITMGSAFPSLVSESVLLYSFSYLGQTRHTAERTGLLKGHAWARAKKYADDHFTDSTLCLQTIADHLGYNPKYISSAFKKNVGMGLAEYLSSLRIRHGCNLIAQGFTSVGDISAQSGFSDAQYFSKVFKQIMGMPPGQYIKEHK